MKFKTILTVAMLFIATMSIAKEYESPMSLYRDNYFITGDDEAQTKFQFSAKYSIFYPSRIGLYAAYTQTSWWKTHDNSSPFYESNYQPEAFFLFESGNNFANNAKLGIIDYIQIAPIFHKSNGRDGAESRGMNLYYAATQLSYGEVYNVGVALKFFGYYNVSRKNSNIDSYIGHYEADVFFKIKSKDVFLLDKEELHFKFGSSKDKGWFCAEVQARIITSYIQPKLFLQVYHGYAEWLINYNEKETSIRAGIIF